MKGMANIEVIERCLLSYYKSSMFLSFFCYYRMRFQAYKFLLYTLISYIDVCLFEFQIDCYSHQIDSNLQIKDMYSPGKTAFVHENYLYPIKAQQNRNSLYKTPQNYKIQGYQGLAPLQKQINLSPELHSTFIKSSIQESSYLREQHAKIGSNGAPIHSGNYANFRNNGFYKPRQENNVNNNRTEDIKKFYSAEKTHQVQPIKVNFVSIKSGVNTNIIPNYANIQGNEMKQLQIKNVEQQKNPQKIFQLKKQTAINFRISNMSLAAQNQKQNNLYQIDSNRRKDVQNHDKSQSIMSNSPIGHLGKNFHSYNQQEAAINVCVQHQSQKFTKQLLEKPDIVSWILQKIYGKRQQFCKEQKELQNMFEKAKQLREKYGRLSNQDEVNSDQDFLAFQLETLMKMAERASKQFAQRFQYDQAEAMQLLRNWNQEAIVRKMKSIMQAKAQDNQYSIQNLQNSSPKVLSSHQSLRSIESAQSYQSLQKQYESFVKNRERYIQQLMKKHDQKIRVLQNQIKQKQYIIQSQRDKFNGVLRQKQNQLQIIRAHMGSKFIENTQESVHQQAPKNLLKNKESEIYIEDYYGTQTEKIIFKLKQKIEQLEWQNQNLNKELETWKQIKHESYKRNNQLQIHNIKTMQLSMNQRNHKNRDINVSNQQKDDEQDGDLIEMMDQIHSPESFNYSNKKIWKQQKHMKQIEQIKQLQQNPIKKIAEIEEVEQKHIKQIQFLLNEKLKNQIIGEDLKQQIRIKGQQISGLSQQIQLKNSEFDKLSKMYEQLKAQVKGLLSSEQVKTKIQYFRVKIEQYENIIEELKRKKNQSEQIRNKSKMHEQSCKVFEHKVIYDLKTQNQRLKEKLLGNICSIGDKKKSEFSRNHSLSMLRNHSTSDIQLKQQKHQRKLLAKKVGDMENRVQELLQVNKSLKAHIEEIIASSKGSSSQTLNFFQGQLQHSDSRSKNLQAKLKYLNDQNIKLRQQLCNSLQNKKNLNSRNNQSQTQGKLESHFNYLMRSSSTKFVENNLKNQLQNPSNKVEPYIPTNDYLINDFKKQIADLQTQNQQLLYQITKKNSELERLKHQNTHYRNEYHRAKDKLRNQIQTRYIQLGQSQSAKLLFDQKQIKPSSNQIHQQIDSKILNFQQETKKLGFIIQQQKNEISDKYKEIVSLKQQIYKITKSFDQICKNYNYERQKIARLLQQIGLMKREIQIIQSFYLRLDRESSSSSTQLSQLSQIKVRNINLLKSCGQMENLLRRDF